MKILGIDTATQFLCLGAYDKGRFYEYNIRAGVKMSSLLAPAIKCVLEALQWKTEDIDYFAGGLGPGSFTGLRLGLAAVKGLSFSLDKPIAAIPTLDTLAQNAKNRNNTLVVPAVDAKRNLIYCSIYVSEAGVLKRKAPYMLLNIDEFIRKIKSAKSSGQEIDVLGDAVALYKDRMNSGVKGANLLDEDYWYPKAHNLVLLALEQIQGKKLQNAFNIKPIYLYPKECQIRK